MTPENDIVAAYARHVNPAFVRLLGTFGYGRVFVRARGTTLIDDQGREYLDMLAAFGAANLGHNPPRLLERLKRCLDDEAMNLIHIGPQPHAAELARDLSALLAPPLEVSLFSNSGGEAVEAALKLARAASGRSAIVYAHGGFHGTGLGALSVLGHARLRKPFEPLLPDWPAVGIPMDIQLTHNLGFVATFPASIRHANPEAELTCLGNMNPQRITAIRYHSELRRPESGEVWSF